MSNYFRATSKDSMLFHRGWLEHVVNNSSKSEMVNELVAIFNYGFYKVEPLIKPDNWEEIKAVIDSERGKKA